ncbi:Hypothetical_protein [Hexamita inflata]|uniref:Hypothetical_protein n=1 Tax=Hexamita inflata TaxID=28002 RepID=A0AA86QAN4_9EUKA|nr:Hypothetical protein HINF_LOCUS37074 [Hexamita inflata]
MKDLPSFALFGLTSNIQIETSNLFIEIPQQLSNGSLLCFVCDVNTSTSDFIFVSSGYNISGFVLSPYTYLVIKESLIQLRLIGKNVGGLVFNSSAVAFSLTNFNISESINGDISGSIICSVHRSSTVQIIRVLICTNQSNLVGSGFDILQLSGVFIESCTICRNSFHAFGLCVHSMNFTHFVGENLICVDSFVFDGEQCSCPEGQVINGTQCINILNVVNILITSNDNIKQSINDVESKVSIQETEIGTLLLSRSQVEAQVQNLYLLSNIAQTSILANESLLQQYSYGRWNCFFLFTM